MTKLANGIFQFLPMANVCLKVDKYAILRIVFIR